MDGMSLCDAWVKRRRSPRSLSNAQNSDSKQARQIVNPVPFAPDFDSAGRLRPKRSCGTARLLSAPSHLADQRLEAISPEVQRMLQRHAHRAK